jgi:serine/threonine protein kinase
VIGQGSTCVVLDVTDRTSGNDYAVKVMSYHDLNSRGLLPDIERELTILRRFSHSHILRFREFLRCGDLLLIVTENCRGGDLRSWISNSRITQKATLKQFVFGIAVAVQFLHSNGIAHNDIKPENIFLDAFGRVKLADFGCAKDRLFVDNAKAQRTLLYAAPETFRSGTYHTQKADIWALGILLYEMATGELPFNDADRRFITQKCRSGRLKCAPGVDRDVLSFVRRLTKVNPNARPTIDAIVEDPFFVKVRTVKQ